MYALHLPILEKTIAGTVSLVPTVAIWVMSEMSEILPICQRAVMLYLSETSETLPRCQADINFEIELIPAIVLSSRVTN